MKYKITLDYPMREKLEELNVTQRGLCEVAGVDLSFFSDALNGKKVYGENVFNKILNAIEKLESDSKLREKYTPERRRYYGRTENQTKKRDDQITLLRSRGLTLQEIGEKMGITKERVRQILKKQ